MRRLSSSETFISKRVFPVVWFGFLGLAFLSGVVALLWGKSQAPWPTLIVCPVMAGIGYFVYMRFVRRVVDEVWDDGDSLLIRNANIQERVPFSNIMNVNSSEMANPPRITLRLRKPCQLGREIVFFAPRRWWPFSRHPLVNELIERANETEIE
jgi:hypothetical protein